MPESDIQTRATHEQIPTTEEGLKRCEVRGNSRLMDIALRGDNLDSKSFELLELKAPDGVACPESHQF